MEGFSLQTNLQSKKNQRKITANCTRIEGVAGVPLHLHAGKLHLQGGSGQEQCL